MRVTWIRRLLIRRISVDSGMNMLTPQTTLATTITNAAPGTSSHLPLFQHLSQLALMFCSMLGIRRRMSLLLIDSAWNVELVNRLMPRSAATTQPGQNPFSANLPQRRREASKSSRQISSHIWSQQCAKTSACSTISTTLS